MKENDIIKMWSRKWLKEEWRQRKMLQEEHDEGKWYKNDIKKWFKKEKVKKCDG